MKHLKRKLMMTLALLLTAATGAWAEETPLLTIESKDYTTFTSGSKTFDDKVTVTFSNEVNNNGNTKGWYSSSEIASLTVAGTNGYTITSCKFYTDQYIAASGYTIEGENPSVYLSAEMVFADDNLSVYIGAPGITKIEVYGGVASSATPVPLTWDATAQTATLTNGMPAGNVTVSVEYFPQAAFAMSTDATPVALAPKASTSARANTDDPLVEGGTVAGIVDGEAVLEEGQGTLLYHFSAKQLDADALKALTATDWTDKVPTADGLAESTVYVYYYIKGADDQPGITQGAKFTFSDSDIQELAVTLAPEPTYNVEFAEGTNPEATAEPIWTASPATGVKKGQTVTVTYSGDRKVIGVKAEKKATKLTITIPATENAAALTLDVTGCTTWEQILDQNITTLDYEGDGVYGQTSNCYILDGNNNRLNLNTPYDPTTNYHWGTQR